MGNDMGNDMGKNLNKASHVFVREKIPGYAWSYGICDLYVFNTESNNANQNTNNNNSSTNNKSSSK